MSGATDELTVPPRIARVAQLYQARWPVADIARHLGVAPRVVRDYAALARRAGLVLPRAPYLGNGNGRIDAMEAARLRRQGVPLPEIARRFGVGVNAVSARTLAMAELGVDIGPRRARRGEGRAP